MKYSNPEIPEGINVSKEHPLKEFFILVAGVGAMMVAAIFVLALLAEWLVRFIPFETEASLADAAITDLPLAIIDNEPSAMAVEEYLQALNDRLILHMDLPEGMIITVHYNEDSIVNAYATLGGHVVIHRGLLAKLESENALAMVVAHEAAHIVNRDPIVAMGRGLTVALALASVTGIGDSGMSQQLLGQLTLFTALTFNRDQESDADQLAMQAVLAEYGHLEGAADLFEVFKQQRGMVNPPEVLSTHPLDDSRIEAIEQYANQSNVNTNESPISFVPLPDFILELRDN